MNKQDEKTEEQKLERMRRMAALKYAYDIIDERPDLAWQVYQDTFYKEINA